MLGTNAHVNGRNTPEQVLIVTFFVTKLWKHPPENFEALSGIYISIYHNSLFS